MLLSRNLVYFVLFTLLPASLTIELVKLDHNTVLAVGSKTLSAGGPAATVMAEVLFGGRQWGGGGVSRNRFLSFSNRQRGSRISN